MFRWIGFAVSVIFISLLAFIAYKVYKRFTPIPVAMVPSLTLVADKTVKLPVFSHVFIIMFENKTQAEVAGSDQAPYLNQLARQYASADNFYATRKPSLPNYLALTGGDTFNVTSNCADCFTASDSIVTQLEAAGHSWKAYMEAMPKPCFVGDAPPLYRQKHNPFIYYDNIRNNPARCNKIVPFTEFANDLKANTLPDYVWITPNMCNDTHDCPISTGDAWLQKWVPQILASPAWQKSGVLFITYDEGDGKTGCCIHAVGGQIVTLVISPLVQPGFVSHVPYNHYSLLRTIETTWHLPLLGKASCDCSLPMTDFFTKPADRGGQLHRTDPPPTID